MSYSIEHAYQQIIEVYDQVVPEQRELLLAKLALVCAERIADDEVLAECLQTAARDLQTC